MIVLLKKSSEIFFTKQNQIYVHVLKYQLIQSNFFYWHLRMNAILLKFLALIIFECQFLLINFYKIFSIRNIYVFIMFRVQHSNILMTRKYELNVNKKFKEKISGEFSDYFQMTKLRTFTEYIKRIEKKIWILKFAQYFKICNQNIIFIILHYYTFAECSASRWMLI